LIQVIGNHHKSTSSSLGILLLNTGTPDSPTPSAVRRFLAQFLSDQRVIDYPRWLWLPLLYGVILNVRPKRSARLYQRIWGPEGSPLLTITQNLRKKLQASLADHIPGNVQVEFAMRYGNPSIFSVFEKLQRSGVEHLIVLPLFPQYSGTTTGTTLEAFFDVFKTCRWMPNLKVISNYHEHPSYIDAIAGSVRSRWIDKGIGSGKLLFSFHGIPQRYSRSGDPYDEQCHRTATLVAEGLNLDPERWKVAFQSRFGPQEWIQPYTDEIMESWGKDGQTNISVICPGFAVDCLETLDEIDHEGRKLFQQAGGGDFDYVPALNDSSVHVQVLKEIILESGNLGEKFLR